MKPDFNSERWHVLRPYRGTNRFPIGRRLPDPMVNSFSIVGEFIGAGGTEDENLSRARMAAAAPALFAALSGALEFFTDARCVKSVHWSQQREAIRAALSAATIGKDPL